MRGTVKWFNETKGFGFITGDDGEDAFAHINNLPDGIEGSDLTEGRAVEFETEQGPKGRRVKTLKLMTMLLLAAGFAIADFGFRIADCQAAEPVASQPASNHTPVEMIDFSAVLGSPAAIVALTMLLVQVVKKNAPNRRYLSAVPIWCYTLAISGALTLLAALGLHSLSGGLWSLLVNTCGNALFALGGYGLLAGLSKTPATAAGITPQKSGGQGGGGSSGGGWPRSAGFILLAVSLCGLPGCGTPSAVLTSQALQTAAMKQYRNEMQKYHAAAVGQMLTQKQAEISLALAMSLRQAADPNGMIAVTVAEEKYAKADGKLNEFRGNLARLDGEFQERQALAGRAIQLGENSMRLFSTYNTLYDELNKMLGASFGGSAAVSESGAKAALNAWADQPEETTTVTTITPLTDLLRTQPAPAPAPTTAPGGT